MKKTTSIYGMFASREKAKRIAKRKNGKIMTRTVKGSRRYIVVKKEK